MPSVKLSAGTIEYDDTGGDKPVVVLVAGVAMDGSLFRKVVDDLRVDHRCVVPTLPLGGHRQPLEPDADVTVRGLGRLIAELLEALELRDVTLLGNDSGAYLFTAAEFGERVGRLVITSCEAFENFPPGLPGTGLWVAARVPGMTTAMLQTLRVPFMRRSPAAFGWMSKTRVPREVVNGWLEPLLKQRAVRRDLVRYLKAAKRGGMMAVNDGLAAFDKPVLIAWAKDDKVMPPDHARRFAELMPHAEVVMVEDSYTLIPEDAPDVLAGHVRRFVASAPAPAPSRILASKPHV
jgi:pimeloyl-ACP methyl ester carboxylesterase